MHTYAYYIPYVHIPLYVYWIYKYLDHNFRKNYGQLCCPRLDKRNCKARLQIEVDRKSQHGYLFVSKRMKPDGPLVFGEKISFWRRCCHLLSGCQTLHINFRNVRQRLSKKNGFYRLRGFYILDVCTEVYVLKTGVFNTYTLAKVSTSMYEGIAKVS
jgi:hypothetical protein